MLGMGTLGGIIFEVIVFEVIEFMVRSIPKEGYVERIFMQQIGCFALIDQCLRRILFQAQEGGGYMHEVNHLFIIERLLLPCSILGRRRSGIKCDLQDVSQQLDG